MTSRFVFTEGAETQTLEILDYLTAKSESAAVRVRDAITTLSGSSPRAPTSATRVKT
jgi:hypothetical protein